MEKHRSMVTATPPPSPTHGESSAATASQSRSPTSVISSSPMPSGEGILFYYSPTLIAFVEDSIVKEKMIEKKLLCTTSYNYITNKIFLDKKFDQKKFVI